MLKLKHGKESKTMIVIGISGKAEHGKTFLANLLKPKFEAKGYKVVIQPLAQVMKEQAKMLGWDGRKDERGRRFLQTFTNPIKEYNGEKCYAKWAYERALDKEADIMLIDDVRMFPEIDYFKELEESGEIERKVYVRVYRPNYVSSLTEEQLNHPTETQLDDYKFDQYITNPGDESFTLEADKLLKAINL
jgi:hypothetical protein